MLYNGPAAKAQIGQTKNKHYNQRIKLGVLISLSKFQTLEMAATTALGVFSGNRLCFRKAESLNNKLSLISKSNSELGFVTSQLRGLKVSYNLSYEPAKPISTSRRPALQTVARNFSPSFSIFFQNSALRLFVSSLYYLKREWRIILNVFSTLVVGKKKSDSFCSEFS